MPRERRASSAPTQREREALRTFVRLRPPVHGTTREKHVMKLILFLSSMLASSCFLGPEARTNAVASPVMVVTDPIPAAKSGITITVDRGVAPALERVMAEYERATGLHLITSPDVAAVLAKTSSGLSQTLEIPAERVHASVERLLLQQGFVVTLLQDQQPILIGIERIENPMVRTRAYPVASANIDSVADHPALLVSTMVTLPSTNVRELSNSARQLMTEAFLQQMVPLGNGNSLMLVGRGSEIATLVKTLKQIDDVERAAQAEVDKRKAAESERREAARKAAEKDAPTPK
jgi:hypothetical protein